MVKRKSERPAAEKPIDWRGSSYKDLLKFPIEARKEAGFQLSQVQQGLDPDHWKAFDDVGAGVREIIVDASQGWFRVMCVSKFEEAIYVLHCFQKKTNKTSVNDREIAEVRYREVIKERKPKP
jgi:phage-related protein